MIKLEVGVSDKIGALCLSLYLAAYFTANLLNGGNDIIFSECMCNYCHTPVTPCHPRQGRKGGMMRRRGGRNEVEMSLGAAGVLVSERKGGG